MLPEARQKFNEGKFAKVRKLRCQEQMTNLAIGYWRRKLAETRQQLGACPYLKPGCNRNLAQAERDPVTRGCRWVIGQPGILGA